MDFTVLIADDEPLERDALESLVRDELEAEPDGNVTIRVVDNGNSAAELIRQSYPDKPVDLAFLDIRMPGRTGLDVAELIRSSESPSHFTAIVFVTAFDYFEYARSAILLKAEDYLVKPVEDDIIRRLVRRVYDRKQPGGNGSDMERHRFSEAVRFLEHELLDDVIAGDIDRIDLEPAFSLLGIPGVSGWAVVVRPDLDSYPFRLENDRQRKTVVERVLTALEHALTSSGTSDAGPDEASSCRFLKRAHSDMGYLICLGGSEVDHRQGLSERVRRAVEVSVARTSVSVRYELSRFFGDTSHMSDAIRTARRACHDVESPFSDDRKGVAERQVLNALLSSPSDRAVAAQEAEFLWDVLAEKDADISSLRNRGNRSIAFLVRTLHNRGIETVPEEAVLIPESVTTRSGLRTAFLESLDGLSRNPFLEDNLSQRMRTYLDAHYREEIRLPDLARFLGISESHCSRQIKRRFGRSFRQVLRDRRLRKAIQLLSQGSLPVSRVAELSGFRDPNYFSRVFQEAHHMSPREYRDTVS